jgi:hypothetical protein
MQRQEQETTPKFENWEGLVSLIFELQELNSIFATEEGIEIFTTGPLEEWDEELKQVYNSKKRPNISSNNWLISLCR